ncbi:MBL fold metallo-hydrolase [Aliihoeflea sp. 40Bstr573]|uniref:MBL fold metallo-hydrolase n=1 Tax=Aliihoeflea sp. 40Bstr573 TaxID=2696467 RepID=UPI002094DE5D|nr:MBL fold metallo-hydrolase [Aliihoeflea sp. 40Bstr573]MCO6388387.1 MBL fold metallo-hydrolase [Aliihoeflea sp. 40Bstr573]
MSGTTDRRTIFKLAGGAAMALTAPQIMVRAASAQIATAPEVGNPGYSSFRLGDFQITTVLDGARPSHGPYPTFGEDQEEDAVAELMEANFLPADQFVNGFAPVIIDTGSEKILFDTGLGEGARANGLGQLRERMQATGHQPDEIDIVVLTHFHGDHIGGLMEGGAPAFANARYVAGQAEYDFWTAPERAEGQTANAAQAVEANVVPLAEDMTFLADGDEVVPGISAVAAFGHTPGHLAFAIESGGRQLMLTADTANHYVASLMRPDWHVRFDMDKEMAVETRKRIFDQIATERIPFIGYHMPFPAVGFVEKIDQGYRYVPATYQFDL